MFAATVDDWQVVGLAVITSAGVFVSFIAAARTGRARWAISAGLASMLAIGYWANAAGANDLWSLRTVRGIGYGSLSWTFLVLPILAIRDSNRMRAHAREAVQIIQAGATEDQT